MNQCDVSNARLLVIKHRSQCTQKSHLLLGQLQELRALAALRVLSGEEVECGQGVSEGMPAWA